jgi:hypothetical protein
MLAHDAPQFMAPYDRIRRWASIVRSARMHSWYWHNHKAHVHNS